jgi:hypothetical protein
LEEIVDAGLDRVKLDALQALFQSTEPQSSKEPSEESLDEIQQLMQRIENDEIGVLEIQDILLKGRLTKEQLVANTSMTLDMIEKINNYQKKETPFNDWDNLPPLENNRTDVYFLGQPGSGKSCVLGAIFSYFDRQGLLAENMHNQVGTLYRNQLKDEFSYGILPDSTVADKVNYMPIDLRNMEKNKLRHPLNFVEMSGEIFNKAYQEGIQSIHPNIKTYLKNKNRKILFFLIDYNLHKWAEKMSDGALQSSKLSAVLEILDNFGTLDKVDAIYVLVMKSDLFPKDRDRKEYAHEFIHTYYLNFINNLKDKKENYARKNGFNVTVFPFTIGDVRFKNILTKPDFTGAETVTKAIQKHAFVTKKMGFVGSIFGN